MFINLSNQKVYCLPDDYEVHSIKLDDIKYNLDPKYDQKEVKALDLSGSKLFANNLTDKFIENKNSRGLDGTVYYPGYIGLNNLGDTDFINVILQTL
jgi:U4/U6.U5 tri-snRNP-associated protein 2